jgi:hypothetical protein
MNIVSGAHPTARIAIAALMVNWAGGAPAARGDGVYPLTLTAGSRLMIAARVNGHAVPALLDSAAEATILDRDFARSAGLGGGEPVTGQGSGKSSFDATMIKGVTLEAIGLSLRGQTVAVADLGDVGRRLLRGRLDAILGREIFDAARLAIDIEGHTIAIVSRERAPRGVRLALQTEHGVETMPVRLGGGGGLVRATFDLGNGTQMLISRALAERLKLLGDGQPARTRRGGGLGGEATRELVTLPAFELAGRRFEGLEAAVDPQGSASDLNVGVSELRHFRITTDFSQHAIWLESRE